MSSQTVDFASLAEAPAATGMGTQPRAASVRLADSSRRRGASGAVQNRPWLAILAALLCLGAAASDPAERLRDPVQEARARALFREVRCLVCQNQSIDESDADLADDLRRIVRQQIAAGRSDTSIRQFLVQRYGEFVLLQPRFSPANALLWLTPFAIVGSGVVLIALRRGQPEREPPLSEAESRRLAELRFPDQPESGSADSATVPPHPQAMHGPSV